jgi:hypothetical protein
MDDKGDPTSANASKKGWGEQKRSRQVLRICEVRTRDDRRAPDLNSNKHLFLLFSYPYQTSHL